MMGEQAFQRLAILGQESIHVGSGYTQPLALDLVSSVPASAYVIVSDHNVAPLHLDALVQALGGAIDQHLDKAKGSPQPQVLTYLIPPGEQSKTRETKAQMEDWLLANKCTRDTCLIALGGGVIGDLVGMSLILCLSEKTWLIRVQALWRRLS
jgi:pentafunctional AROM polypeptide